jgi:hypothetical protein
MGGFGSGRRSGGGKRVAEHCSALDVNHLRKAGAIADGWAGSWAWTRNGEKTASIFMRSERNHVTLTYRWRPNGADWQDVTEVVAIRWVDCRYGGQRPFFVCPGGVLGVICARRSIKLYSAGQYFLCRHCHRLRYAVQSEDRWDRAMRKAGKIRTKLGAEPGLCAPLPRRPKGLWHRTYEGMMKAIFEAEELVDERLSLMAARILRADEAVSSGRNQTKKGRFWQ